MIQVLVARLALGSAPESDVVGVDKMGNLASRIAPWQNQRRFTMSRYATSRDN